LCTTLNIIITTSNFDFFANVKTHHNIR
jgi:hypothetical protein